MAVLALPLLAASVLGAPVPSLPAANPTNPPPAAIPPSYLADFVTSGERFGVPWGVLAGIYKLECDFGQAPEPGCNPRGTENSAGAQGPGQFLPTTWRYDLVPFQLIPPGPPAEDGKGYATDGDGDGIADPWDPADAVASTARLLAANGADAGNLDAAVWAYNHDPTYVDEVTALAGAYQGSPATPGAAGGVGAVLVVAESQLGKPYLWGGAGPEAYDCSGLVVVAFAAAGVTFPHDAAAQYTLSAANPVPLGGLLPGDLVFFGTTPATIDHVGIYVGAGEMIDAPHTGAVVRIESIGWPDLLAATRPLAGG
ncbi:MAG: C40 family peptidase [Acidimicrobiales bacterium]